MMTIVNSGKLSLGPNAPFSHAVAAGDFLFLSGQIGADATGKLADGMEAQAEQAIQNIGAILAEKGIGYEKVVKATCFLTDIGNFAAFNTIYSKYFTGKPARSCFAVKDLPLGAEVEVEVIAYLG